MKTITASNIQRELEKANCVIFNHCSDLYTPVTKISEEIIDNFEFKQNVTKFNSEIDGSEYYDIPFCFTSAPEPMPTPGTEKKVSTKYIESNYIDIKDMSCSTEGYPRIVSISFNGKSNKITLLGNLSHGTELSIDKENGKKLIKLIEKCIQ